MEVDGKNKVLQRSGNCFDYIDDGVLLNILQRLPAPSFAIAACVSKSWNRVCHDILFSRPKLSSALSCNSSPTLSLEEVVNKVLSKPIHPDFALAHVTGSAINLDAVLAHLAQRLGWKTPIIVTRSDGVMGRNVSSNEFLEFNGEDAFYDECERPVDSSCVLLVVGSLPSLKMSVIPIKKEAKAAKIRRFVMDIKNFSVNISGSSSPALIMMFGKEHADLKPIIDGLDKTMSKETIIVGNERCEFLYRTGEEPKAVASQGHNSSDAVSLVFTKNSRKPTGVPDIQFHTGISRGLSSVGPVFQAVSVRYVSSCRISSLTAKRVGFQQILDGQEIISEINAELENRFDEIDLFIGITRKRKSVAPYDNTNFYGTIVGIDDRVHARGTRIQTRDYFQFYRTDCAIASSSCGDVSSALRNLKENWPEKNAEFIGGMIFACSLRGQFFFGRSNVDSSPFLDNFSSGDIAGVFCSGEIARGVSTDDDALSECFLHKFSTVYVGFSCAPAVSVTSKED